MLPESGAQHTRHPNTRQGAAERLPDSSRGAPAETAPTSAADRLRAQLDREAEPHPPAWRPEVGDELIGTFEGWREGVTRRGERHPIAIVCDEHGERRAVWCFYAVLRAELEQAAPVDGELVAIRRLPDRENAEGQPYRVFRVAVDRDQGELFGECAPPVDAPADWQLAGRRES